jgi:DNA repair exonuclease SbcCD ATPase subunit
MEQIIKEIKESLENIEGDFKENSGSIQVIEESINDAKRRKDLEEINFASLKEKGDDLDTCKFILGEEGVKAFVVKKLLGMLNTSIQTYINDLGMTMKCKFDEFFVEQITNDKGKEISYWNFSGGERRTVDLACAWAFKDIKRKISGISSNVEFCDEIFDSAFDERGLDLLIEVLKDRIDKYNMSIYAISHRKETMKHIDGEIVALEKENGVTKRVEEEL